MLKAKSMKKFTIFGSKNYMKSVVKELYDLNAVHIVDHTKSEDDDVFDIGEPYEENEKYAELLVKVRALISNLNIKNIPAVSSTDGIDEIEKDVRTLDKEVSVMLLKKQYYEKVADMYRKGWINKALKQLKITDQPGLSMYVGFTSSVEHIEERLRKITTNYSIRTINYDGLKLIGLFVPEKKEKEVEEFLETYDFSPIDNPVLKEHYKFKAKIGQKYVKMDNELNVANNKLEDIDEEINSVSEKNHQFLLSTEQRLHEEVEKAEAPLKFATTENTFLIKGWIAAKDANKVKSHIEELTKGNVGIKLENPGKHDDVPIVYNHPKIVQPFEAFMDMYSLPTYREIDPTFFMFLTFPFFFGLMLGDVGYGLITLALFMFLKKKMPSAKNMLNAFIIASISTIFFGIIFGEYMGFEYFPEHVGENIIYKLPHNVVVGLHMEPMESHGEVVYPFPHLFARSHQISDLLSVSILFGIAHILIALIFGFINVYKAHGFKHAMLEKGGWIMILPMMVWILLNFLGIVSGYIAEILTSIMPPDGLVFALFGIGSILVIKGEGVRGLLEVMFLSLMSNIISYARLMAVGLASLSLAVVVNDMATGMFHSGIGGIIGGIVILLIGHGINIALGILSPFLHSIRLHYVEFFQKFYTGGGKAFKRFGYLKE